MKHYRNMTALAFGVLAGTAIFAGGKTVAADTLDTEIAGAGIAVALNDYTAGVATEAETQATDISTLIPQQSAEEAQQQAAQASKDKENKYFEDIAITSVTGDDYVNVRKKPSTESKVVGKVYSNCGAVILETTEDGWYKVRSGNVTGYIKADYFVTGSEAEDYALDAGYVIANMNDTGIRVRTKPTTESEVVTNVYQNEHYVIKKFSKDGSWVKIKMKKPDGEGSMSGWVSSRFR